MSRYTRLEQLGVALAQRFNQIEMLAEDIAQTFIFAFTQYLDAPADRIQAVTIDGDLNPVEVLATGKRPVVTHGQDGLWYFGIQLTYGSTQSFNWLTDQLLMSIKVDAPDAQSYQLGVAGGPLQIVSTPNERETIFGNIFRTTEERLTRDFRVRTGFIGFTDIDR